MPAGTVEVFLIGAVGLKDNVIGKADPYAVLLCGKHKLRSNTASNQGSKPTWNQKFSFYIDDKAGDLQIKVYNHRFLAEDEELGSTTIPLTRVFADGKLPTTSYNIVRPSGRVQGEVKLSLAFIPKQRPGQMNVPEMPGPYNEKVHGSPYAAIPPEPTVKHDPLTGPEGYFRTNANTSASSHGSKPSYLSSDSNLGGNRPSYPPSEGSTHPSMLYPPGPPTSPPYRNPESGHPYQHSSSFSSDEGSSHGSAYPVTSSASADFNGSMYVQSPYGAPRPAPPPHLSGSNHLGATAMSSGPPAYPPPYASGSPPNRLGATSMHSGPPSYPPPYTSSSQNASNQFQFDDLAGNFGSMKISGGDVNSSSHGYHSAPSFHDNGRPAGYPPMESMSGNSAYDYQSNDRPGSGYPPPAYPAGGYPPQYDSSQGEFQRPGPYSQYGYQNPPPSYYPQELGVPQQPYARNDEYPPQSAYPPAPYYNAPPANYVPAGYPR